MEERSWSLVCRCLAFILVRSSSGTNNPFFVHYSKWREGHSCRLRTLLLRVNPRILEKQMLQVSFGPDEPPPAKTHTPPTMR
ncbi:Fe-S oxidoreductase FadF [Sesbania bispinosa]|nr:Fe-S oxidoreductase FadF [Sesbania bispinosa]